MKDLHLEIQSTPLLRGISFEIQAGEFVAIVGEVGSGKSLLLLSLLRETGARFKEYRIDGVPYFELPESELRAQFAYIPQEGFVMSATLFENVAFDYEPKPEQRARAEHSLAAAEFPGQNLNSEIGERGVNLSGGQRQRVGLGRAHFFDRPIILMDDCLSALDIDTERRLIDHLFAGDWKSKTRVLVTHRLSVLPRVDRVLFMQEGKLIAFGRYEELMNQSEPFRNFVHSTDRLAAEQTAADRTRPGLTKELDEGVL